MTETLGFLLQGVSQQQPKIRSTGQVTEQVNFHSDVNRGLTTRPATERLGATPAVTDEGSKSFTVDLSGTLYRIVLEEGKKPKVFGYDGSAKTVTNVGSPNAYVSTDAAVYTYDDVVYILNRGKTVATKVVDYSSTVTENWAYVYCLGGLFSRTYSMDLTVGSTTVTAAYTTPDGTAAGDPEKATTDYIIHQLNLDLVSALSGASVTGVTIQEHDNELRITHSGDNITAITCRDGEAGSILKCGLARAETIADLPRYAEVGDYIFVYGATDSADDFWMRFEIAGNTTVGTGFGDEGAWKEYFNINDSSTLDETTMPHKLVDNGDDTFTFSAEDWEYRRVGDEDSNPTPSFVGAKIRDIREFQGRLMFCTSAATVVASRTDYPTDFYKKTATAETASDPVDMRATQEGTKPFDWMVPFDRNMFVLASNAQFVISGNGSLTPSNASMVLATNYTMSSNARPQATGRTMLFPFMGQQYAGVNEYFAGNDFASTSVDNLTKTTAKYVEGEIREIAVATNEGLALFLTDISFEEGWVWVYKYLWEFDKKTQSAWYKWKFPGKVRHIHIADGIVYFWIVIGDDHVFMGTEDVMWDEEDAAYEYFDLEEIVVSMRLDIPDMYDFDYPLSIDGAVTGAGEIDGDYLIINTTYTQPRFILNSTGSNAPPGGVIVPDDLVISGEENDTTITYKFNIVDRPWLLDGVISYGQRIERYLDPTPPVARKFDGSPRSDVQTVVRAYYIDYQATGQFEAQMQSAYRGNETMANTDWFPMDDDPLHPWSESVRDGTLQVPWGEYSNLATLRVYSDDIRPTTIQEIRYDPEYLKAGG